MTHENLERHPIRNKLTACARQMEAPEHHLRRLIDEPDRMRRFSVTGGGLFYDFSRQRVTGEIMSLLTDLAADQRLRQRFEDMMAGRRVNATENRAALHTACRPSRDAAVLVDDVDAVAQLRHVRQQVRAFADGVRKGDITGSTGKPFRHVIVTGIGGSYLGTEFVANALEYLADDRIRLWFLSNVDIHNFDRIAARIDLEAALWVIISKSYTTAETMANARQAAALMAKRGLDPSRHTVTVTSQGSPGDDPDTPVLASFHMFDYIGGRYSVTSAVGAVPLSLYLGPDTFEQILHGAADMDRHAANSRESENLPLLAALITVWNTSFLHYPAQAIVPYAAPLNRLPAHIQQLNMESNGKSVTMGGDALTQPTGPFIFGEPGTNAQHSFFQLAHQGRPLPIEFIGVLSPAVNQYGETSGGVTNHQELWANLIAQPMALAVGADADNPARAFSGNRPSSTLVLTSLKPDQIGRLLAFYEARTVFEAFAWGINPFDQFGVELGKTTASGIREQLALKNTDPAAAHEGMHPIVGFYLDMLDRKRF